MKCVTIEMRSVNCCYGNNQKDIKLDKEQFVYIIKDNYSKLADNANKVVENMKSCNINIINIEYKEDICIVKYEITDDEIISDIINYDWLKNYK